jgi:uncharacterized membrane protein YfcA
MELDGMNMIDWSLVGLIRFTINVGSVVGAALVRRIDDSRGTTWIVLLSLPLSLPFYFRVTD